MLIIFNNIKWEELKWKKRKEAKLRKKINEKKSDIKELYTEIGKKVYEKHVREENIDINSDLEEECTKIDVLSAEIETCLKSILELKDKKQCPICHKEIEKNANFCSNCGEKLEGAKITNAEEVKEELENSEVEADNETEKEIVEEEVSGEESEDNTQE